MQLEDDLTAFLFLNKQYEVDKDPKRGYNKIALIKQNAKGGGGIYVKQSNTPSVYSDRSELGSECMG